MRQLQEDKLKEITDKLEEGIKKVFSSDRYKEYLSAMNKFHGYSYNNLLLIMMQKPDASLVAGYKTWQSMERQVKKGEKGIMILAPCPKKKVVYIDKIDPRTREPVRDREGNIIKERKEINYATFHPVAIFDVSQTEGKELPSLAGELKGQVPDYTVLLDAIKEVAPAPVRFAHWEESKKGYYSPAEQEIVIKSEMSELQTVKTVIHETAHSILHSDLTIEKDRSTAEVEAESVAFVVCQHLGLDTSDYSFGYLASWSSDKGLPELKSSLSIIQKTSQQLIEQIDKAISKRTNNLDISAELADQEQKIPGLGDIHRHRR